jgi:mono/diheme cytochrome c family protein
MTFKFTPFPSALGVVLAISACTAAMQEPDARDARWAETRWPGTTIGDLRGGMHLFESKCASCHALPDPGIKSPDQWANVIGEMAPRARLSDDQRESVLRYLSAASARAHGDGSPATASTHAGAVARGSGG